LVSLTQIQEVPPKNPILLVGPSGSGKSTFCEQVILQNLAMDRPAIFVTTEYGPSEAERTLKEQGLSKVETGMLNYVDAYKKQHAKETKRIATGDPYCEWEFR